jgi:hypothetical protein
MEYLKIDSPERYRKLELLLHRPSFVHNEAYDMGR